MAGLIRFSKLVHIIINCKYFDSSSLRNPPHAHSANRCAQLKKTPMRLLIYFLIIFMIIDCSTFQNKSIISNLIPTDSISSDKKTSKLILSYNDTLAEINKNVIKTSYFKDILSQDSIKILEFKKNTNEIDTPERLIYIDFKKSTNDKMELAKFDIEKHDTEIKQSLKESKIGQTLRNDFKFLKNTYLIVVKIKGKYCIDFMSLYFPEVINDSIYVNSSMDGFIGCYYDLDKQNDLYSFNLKDNILNFQQLDIKVIDSILNVQIWRLKRSPNDCDYFYALKMPLKEIIDLPVLYTKFSRGHDMCSDFYDKIDYKMIFEK